MMLGHPGHFPELKGSAHREKNQRRCESCCLPAESGCQDHQRMGAEIDSLQRVEQFTVATLSEVPLLKTHNLQLQRRCTPRPVSLCEILKTALLKNLFQARVGVCSPSNPQRLIHLAGCHKLSSGPVSDWLSKQSQLDDPRCCCQGNRGEPPYPALFSLCELCHLNILYRK